MTVSETLKEARKQHGWSMRAVGEMIGKSHQVVYFAEKSAKGISDDGELLELLCACYGIQFKPLFEKLKEEKALQG